MDLSFYSKLLNISNKEVNTGELIKAVIKTFNEKYNNISDDRMCKVFSHNIYCALREKSINCRKINIKELFQGIDHEFVLCWDFKDNKIIFYLFYYTFNQFLNTNLDRYLENINFNLFSNLHKYRYSIVDDDSFNDYLSAFGIKTKISLSDIIMENYCKKKK